MRRPPTRAHASMFLPEGSVMSANVSARSHRRTELTCAHSHSESLIALRKSSIRIESDSLTGYGVHRSLIIIDPLMVCRNMLID
jgi:hypothetical protein